MGLKDHGGTWKKSKSKSQKYIRTFGSHEKGPQVKVKKYTKDFWTTERLNVKVKIRKE